MEPVGDADVAPILKNIRPAGWVGALALAAMGMPIWMYQAAKLAYGHMTRYEKMSSAKDRSKLQLPEPFPGLTREMVDVGGLRLHAVSPGRKPNKPLLLMVHGFPECWYSWRYQMAAFREEFDCVAIDMRGYNESDKPQGVGSYTMDKLVADIPAVVRGLGHPSCTLVAHDWGGIIAWLAAACHPDVVKRLVVMAAPHIGLAQVNMSLAQSLRSWYILFFQAPWLPELLLMQDDCQFIAGAFKGQRMGVCNASSITDTDIEWFKQSQQMPGAATAGVNYYRALLRHLTCQPVHCVWEAMKRRVRVPVLLLWGEKDPVLLLKNIENIEQVAPDVEVHVVKDCSHWVQQDQHEEVNSLMAAFFARTKDAIANNAPKL